MIGVSAMSKHRGKKGLEVDNKATNNHHLCWPRRKWDRVPEAVRLRNYPYCIIELPQNTVHRHIHESMREIPVPNGQSAQHALEQLKLLESHNGIGPSDPIEKRLMVLAAMFDRSAQETADALRRQLKIVCGYKAPK